MSEPEQTPADDQTESDANTAPEEETVPQKGRLLGVDFGTVRVGLSVSSPDQSLASPLETITRTDREQERRRIIKLVAEYRIVGIVVGLPVHISGDESGMSRLAREYGAWLKSITDLPLKYWDERFSSGLADDVLAEAEMTKKQRKARRDMIASQILLQNFLDTLNRDRTPDDLSRP